MRKSLKERIKSGALKATVCGGLAIMTGATLSSLLGLTDPSFMETGIYTGAAIAIPIQLYRVAYANQSVCIEPEELNEYGLDVNTTTRKPEENGMYCFQKYELPYLLNRNSILP